MAELLNTTIKATGDTEDSVLNVTKNDANSSSILNIKENGDISITNTNGIEIKINNNGSINIKDSSESNILSISGNGVITINKELAISDNAKTTGIFSGNSVSPSTQKDGDTQKISIPKIEIANGKVSFSTSTINLPKYAGSSSADGPANSVANYLTFSTTGSGDTGSYNGEAPKTISYNSIGALPATTKYASSSIQGGAANSVANYLTFSTTGSGDTDSYNGSAPKTISWNSVGALPANTTYAGSSSKGGAAKSVANLLRFSDGITYDGSSEVAIDYRNVNALPDSTVYAAGAIQNGNAVCANTIANALTFSDGTTYNGSEAKTIDWNSVGALPANTTYAGSDIAGGAANKVAEKLTFSNVVNKAYDGSNAVTISFDDVGALANDTPYALRK